MENENENENEEENRDRNIYKDKENFWEFFLCFPWYKSKWKRTELSVGGGSFVLGRKE